MRLAILFLWLLLPLFQAQAAERILALSPHACEILSAIGAADEIIGVVDYCDYPPALSHLPNLGGYNRIQVESAMGLKPTMAIVMNDGTPAASKLRALGVHVEASNPLTIEQMLAEIERLGRLSGHREASVKLVRSLRGRLRSLAKSRPHKPLRVFYEIWPDPLVTAGGTSLIHDVLVHLGLTNVFASIPMEGPKVNVEAVVRARPEIVILPAGERDVAERKRFWKKWLGEQVRVVAINADLLHRPTPRLIDGMEMLAKRLETHE